MQNQEIKNISLYIQEKAKSYNIFIYNKKFFESLSFANKSKILVITHEHIYLKYKNIFNFNNLNYKYNIYFLPDGEEAKTWDNLEKILSHMLELKLDRNSLVIALGGGVIGDIAGFASSIYQRGIDFIQAPTSLLAMVDSSVGGKTAVNLKNYGKNLIGSFYQPSQVIIDINFLETLPEVEFKNGMAEVCKYSLLRQDSGEFYNWLINNKNLICKKNPEALIHMIETCVGTKANIVSQDEKEISGKRALLNLGHTFGHSIETASNYKIPHGQAVGIGILMSADLSLRLNKISQETHKKIFELIKLFELEQKIPEKYKLKYNFSAEALYENFKLDKKTENSRLKFIIPAENTNNSEILEVEESQESNIKNIILEILNNYI